MYNQDNIDAQYYYDRAKSFIIPMILYMFIAMIFLYAHSDVQPNWFNIVMTIGFVAVMIYIFLYIVLISFNVTRGVHISKNNN